MTSTMVIVLVATAAVGWPAAPPPRHLGSRPRSFRSAVPDPHFWGLSSVERGRGERVLAAVAAGWFGFALGSPAAVVVAPLLVGTLLRERARRRRRRTEAAHADSLLEFVEAVAAGLRSGGSLSGSIVTAAKGEGPSSRVGSAHPGLQRLVAGVAAGRALPVAFSDAFSADPEVPFDRHRSGRSDEELLTVTIVALEATGGSATEAVDRVGDALRERCAARADARTQAQQAISSAAVMAALPLLFGFVAALAEPGVGHLYRSTWVGAACAGSAVLFTIVGWEWQQRLIGGGR